MLKLSAAVRMRNIQERPCRKRLKKGSDCDRIPEPNNAVVLSPPANTIPKSSSSDEDKFEPFSNDSQYSYGGADI
jgi:hypothetical protein